MVTGLEERIAEKIERVFHTVEDQTEAEDKLCKGKKLEERQLCA